MFNRRTLFVVGAGASAEFNLPVGGGLAAKIIKKMDMRFEGLNQPIGEGDLDLFVQLTQRFTKNGTELQQAAWRIRDGLSLARSIDDFLDIHRSDVFANFYGKAAIVKTILEAERDCALYFAPGDSFDPQKSANTWIARLMSLLCRGVPKEEVYKIFDQIAFIAFNYDRCIEHYFLNALQRLYAISAEEAQKIVQRLTIFHPYGSVGDYPFGQTRVDYRSLSERIKTYTEQIEEQNTFQEELSRARAVVFLGFAYHNQNMQLIRPTRPLSEKPMFGTAFGMSDSDVAVTTDQLLSWYGGGERRKKGTVIHIENKLRCVELFDYYEKTLTAGD